MWPVAAPEFLGGIEGKNAFLRGQKSIKNCQKWLILAIFSSDGGRASGGAEPPTGGKCPPCPLDAATVWTHILSLTLIPLHKNSIFNSFSEAINVKPRASSHQYSIDLLATMNWTTNSKICTFYNIINYASKHNTVWLSIRWNKMLVFKIDSTFCFFFQLEIKPGKMSLRKLNHAVSALFFPPPPIFFKLEGTHNAIHSYTIKVHFFFLIFVFLLFFFCISFQFSFVFQLLKYHLKDDLHCTC